MKVHNPTPWHGIQLEIKEIWLRLWEMYNPSPPPNIETFESDSRPQEAEKIVNKYLTLAPQLPIAHNINVHNPEVGLVTIPGINMGFIATHWNSLG